MSGLVVAIPWVEVVVLQSEAMGLVVVSVIVKHSLGRQILAAGEILQSACFAASLTLGQSYLCASIICSDGLLSVTLF